MSDDANYAICPCTGLTIAQVKQALAEGATSTQEIFERCNEYIFCSRCVTDIDDMVFAAKR